MINTSLQSLESNWTQTSDSFEEMNLSESLLRGIYSFGFEKPSAIQERGILPILTGRDTIAQAQSGTGKTATFVISTLQLIDKNCLETQALILAPTRELAQQTYSVVTRIGTYMGLYYHLSTGGSDVRSEKKKLARGAHVVVGTPGRVFDMMRNKHLNTQGIKILVIDEADEMLSRGFLTQIQDIFSCLPGDVQCCLFSATLSPSILKLTDEFMRDPVRILVKNEELTLEGITQFYVPIKDQSGKPTVLLDLYENLDISQAMIYVNTRHRAEELAQILREDCFVVGVIHGQVGTEQRKDIMKEFREGYTRVLITTDLLSRGIDVHQVNIVINFDMPLTTECYLHRIGRSGRFGKKGIAINFMTPNDAEFLTLLEQHYATQIEELPSDLADI